MFRPGQRVKNGDVVSIDDRFKPGRRGVVVLEQGAGTVVLVRVCKGHPWCIPDAWLTEAEPFQPVGTFPFCNSGKGRV